MPGTSILLSIAALVAVVADRLGEPEAAEAVVPVLEPFEDHIVADRAVVLGSAAHFLGLAALTAGRLDEAEDAAHRGHRRPPAAGGAGAAGLGPVRPGPGADRPGLAGRPDPQGPPRRRGQERGGRRSRTSSISGPTWSTWPTRRMTERAPLAGLTVVVTRARAAGRRSGRPAASTSAPRSSRLRSSRSTIRPTAAPPCAGPRPAAAGGGSPGWWSPRPTAPSGWSPHSATDRPAPTRGSRPSVRPRRPCSSERESSSTWCPTATWPRPWSRRSPGRSGSGRVLIARAAVARDVLPEGLAAMGWEVEVVEAYRTEPADASPRRARRRRPRRTSSRSRRRRRSTAPSPGWALDHVPAVVACIGPITADAARDHGSR